MCDQTSANRRQTGSLYRHLAGSQLHRRDEVGNIIQQLVQLGDTLEAMQVPSSNCWLVTGSIDDVRWGINLLK
jgi:hypothetical protein